ncbi:glycosyltransferase family 39 protein [Patescibacteria group bacterium]|nr:glycosyltransferase family 39 protein [Patescibacteria group bacterium]
MDNARDMVDVREMVILKKLRLIGPTSAIEGFYNGPFWYYLLAIPFILSGGNPYSAILMEIGLWTIGGFFLLKLVNRWGRWLMLPIGAIWIASNYIVLTNLYAFNPNPVTLLAPLFIYLLVQYLKEEKAIYIISAWILAGLFFNFEMNFGVFTPAIILTSITLTKRYKLLKQKWFWIGVGLFILTLLPQIIFDFKHQFIMSKAILRHLAQNPGSGLNVVTRFQVISASFYNTFLPTLLNQKLYTQAVLALFIPVMYWFFRKGKKDLIVIVSLIFVFTPFVGYLFLPVTVNPWHLGGEMAVSLILISFLIKRLWQSGILGKFTSLILSISIIFFSLGNIINFFAKDFGKTNLDPSLYKNEIAAIDYVYKYANGQNFKVYVFMPSVYDYPYQYLFWWYGKKQYGYIPAEYAYAPDETLYISNKDKFSGSKEDFKGLVFLVKEPNRGYNWKSGWEGKYKSMELLSADKVGSIEIEVRNQLNIKN